MLDRVMRELKRYRDPRQLIRDLAPLRGPVQRTPEVLERLFPKAIWGHSDRKNGPLLLTFDDGPNPEVTPYVLDVLKQHRVKAVFFLSGEKLAGKTELVAHIRREGHAVGYHGASHKAWWALSPSMQRVEMDPSVLPGIDIKFSHRTAPLLLRPPYGRFDYAAQSFADDLGALLILWRLVIGDWKKGVRTDQMVERLLKHTHAGDIIVLHDGGSNGNLLPKTLDTVIPLWKYSGLHFGSVQDFVTEAQG